MRLRALANANHDGNLGYVIVSQSARMCTVQLRLLTHTSLLVNHKYQADIQASPARPVAPAQCGRRPLSRPGGFPHVAERGARHPRLGDADRAGIANDARHAAHTKPQGVFKHQIKN